MDEWTYDLEQREAFENDKIERFYGHVEYAHKQMVLKLNDICYSTSIFTEDGYHESDKRLFELLANTFKTEEEGAYDPIYSGVGGKRLSRRR